MLRQVPVPDMIWAQDRPPAVLSWMSRSLGEFEPILRSAAPEGLHGAAFYSEAWTVESGKPGTAKEREVSREADAHRLHLHPDRVEARSMWAVDRAGITYGAILNRGESEARTQVAYPGPGRKVVSGTVPQALERIVMAVLGVRIG